jgi:hypothetical protein
MTKWEVKWDEVRNRNEKPLIPQLQTEKHERYSVWGRFVAKTWVVGNKHVLHAGKRDCSWPRPTFLVEVQPRLLHFSYFSMKKLGKGFLIIPLASRSSWLPITKFSFAVRVTLHPQSEFVAKSVVFIKKNDKYSIRGWTLTEGLVMSNELDVEVR